MLRGTPRALGALSLACVACREPATPAVDALAPVDVAAADAGCGGFARAVHNPMFHRDRRRSGWNDLESDLTPERLARGEFSERWSTPVLASATFNGRAYAPHLFASPLTADRVAITAGAFAGRTLDLVFVATTNNDVYAVNAFDAPCAGASAGAVVWHTRLAPPRFLDRFDGGIPMGVLSTPVIDLDASRIYLTAMTEASGWQAFALDLGSGAMLPSWPVSLDAATVDPVNQNPPAHFAAPDDATQRGALALSPDGNTLYLGFSSQRWTATGWTVAVSTRAPRVLASFSSAASGNGDGRGGVWGSGGPAIDDSGAVFVTTGNGPEHLSDRPGFWADSLLRWSPGLALTGSYTPFNFCALDEHDMDLSSSSPTLIDLASGTSNTPHLAAFGGKQGALYLVDRDRMPGRTDHRPACGARPSEDTSLLAPEAQPQFGERGPLQVFRPYTEVAAMVDFARMHTTLAQFRGADGTTFLYASGASKVSDGDSTSVPPCLFRLRVVAEPTRAAYLRIERENDLTLLVNPGPPVVSSDGAAHPIVWVLDANQRRSAPLVGDRVAGGVLYAFDGVSLALLWRSEALGVGGKYSEVAVAHGTVFVGTDRLRAFGMQ